jgi:hypothetical protein
MILIVEHCGQRIGKHRLRFIEGDTMLRWRLP